MPEPYSWTSVCPINLLANIGRASLSPCAYVLVRWTASCTIGVLTARKQTFYAQSADPRG